MHSNCYANNLFAPENFKCVEINKDPVSLLLLKHAKCYVRYLDCIIKFQLITHHKNILQPSNVKCNNFLSGLLNAKNILYSLEKSLKKTQTYEDRMLQCRCNHSHTGNNERHFVLSDEKDSIEGCTYKLLKLPFNNCKQY